MKIPFYWVDAFTQNAFRGNPAGVCPLASWLTTDVMQAMAREHGLSETAFFVPVSTGRYHLRWFTPATEVDLCGHATLASAHALFAELGLPGAEVAFDSRSGPLTVRRTGDKLELDFPARPGLPAPADSKLVSALGATPAESHRSGAWMFIYDSAEAVAALAPDFSALRKFGDLRVIVTAPGSGEIDFVSRFFAPGAGIDEDPVTGSAHCTLVPYWAKRLGRPRLRARQISPRGGDLWCELAGDRVRIAGYAQTYLRGEIDLPPNLG